MDLNLKEKVIVVTGGNSGLGASIAECFAQEGAHVVVNYLVNEEEAMSFVSKLNKKYNTSATALYGDITETTDIDNIFRIIEYQYGHADILVNNAGTWPTAYVENMTDREWEKTIKINLTGPFLFSKRMVQHLRKHEISGKIINIVSQAAFHGSTSGHAHYAAAKGGVVTFTKSLAREVAKYGINVVAVAPGMMRTPMNEEELKKRGNEYLDRIPLGRIADSMEVAYPVVFLASDKADYITGSTIDVTGGMLMR